jgi:citrate/tricarballylate utilization protein
MSAALLADPAHREAERLMTICNACRYCEGLCAVFPAMELRRDFSAGDLDYLAHLCHRCGACYDACQFAPPHEFAVNVPRALEAVRKQSYRRLAWPAALAPLFARNGLAVASIASLSVAAFVLGFMALVDPATLFAVHVGPGAFYRVMPHGWMVAIFGAAFLFAVLAMAMSVRRFWRAVGAPPPIGPAAAAEAAHDAARLTYLGGGGAGCERSEGTTPDRRRLWHHLTFYGFLLCFASTSTATLYAYGFGREAPYAWWELPVVLGTIGGLGLLAGPAGLFLEARRAGEELRAPGRLGMDAAFTAMLFLTSLTGLALLVLRETPAMGALLALHLGFVFGFFLTMPYGRFMHGLYRAAALVRYAAERRRA